MRLQETQEAVTGPLGSSGGSVPPPSGVGVVPHPGMRRVQAIKATRKERLPWRLRRLSREGPLSMSMMRKNRHILTLSTEHKPEDGLAGYTSSTVSMRRGSFIYTYNEKGGQISTHAAG